jgi:hypothetical protein
MLCKRAPGCLCLEKEKKDALSKNGASGGNGIRMCGVPGHNAQTAVMRKIAALGLMRTLFQKLLPRKNDKSKTMKKRKKILEKQQSRLVGNGMSNNVKKSIISQELMSKMTENTRKYLVTRSDIKIGRKTLVTLRKFY